MRGALPSSVWGLAGFAICLVLLMTLGATGVVYFWSTDSAGLMASDWAAFRFTITQALLSASLSVLLAIPVARGLSRRRFWGRSVLITLLGAPFILPVIVAVLGLLAVFGRSGILNGALEFFGLPAVSIYGLHGVVLAHVFFNMPLATRLLLGGWQSIPAERLRLSAALGFGPTANFKHIEWPMLRRLVPRCFLLIFLICLTSFAVALTLGGGPKATTIELAIYQAFTFDFDLGRAARLAVLQFCLGVGAAAIAFYFTVPERFGAGEDRSIERWDAKTTSARTMDVFWISVAALFLIVPLAMVAAKGIPHLGKLDAVVFTAAGRSIAVALASVALVLILALPLALLAARGNAIFGEGIALLLVSASPLVMGTGLFLIVFPLIDPRSIALPATALVNAMAALPFALRSLVPAVEKAEQDFGRLAISLAMPPTARLRLVVLPRIRAPLTFAAALSGALSMGDLGVITLFSGSDTPTLPLMIYRLMGSYQMDAAAAASLLLLGLSLGMFWLLDQGGRSHA